jgi:hypothetical protein
MKTLSVILSIMLIGIFSGLLNGQNFQGRKKAIIFLGHINSEEAGMSFCAEWLQTFIKDVPVHYIECGPSFWSY